jgi:hypothetical protein
MRVGFLLWLDPYIDEIIGNHQRGFRCDRSITDQILLHSSDKNLN